MQVKGQGSKSCAHCSCSSTGSKALAPAAMSDPTVPPYPPMCLNPPPQLQSGKIYFLQMNPLDGDDEAAFTDGMAKQSITFMNAIRMQM